MGIHGKNMLVWASKNGNFIELTNKIWGFITNHTENLMWYTINDIWVWVWYLNMGIVSEFMAIFMGNSTPICPIDLVTEMDEPWWTNTPQMVIFTRNMIINRILGSQFSGKAGCGFSLPRYQLGFPMPSSALAKNGRIYLGGCTGHSRTLHQWISECYMLLPCIRCASCSKGPLEARIPHLEMGCWKRVVVLKHSDSCCLR